MLNQEQDLMHVIAVRYVSQQHNPPRPTPPHPKKKEHQVVTQTLELHIQLF